MKTATQTEQPTAAKKMPSMLQQIRQRFTSGRPRVLPQDPVGSLLALQLGNVERDKIVEFITAQGGDISNFTVGVFVVTLRPKDLESYAARAWPLPNDMDGIIRLADAMRAEQAIQFLGLLVSVSDKKAGTALQYTRPFKSSKDAAEGLAYASLQQRFSA